MLRPWDGRDAQALGWRDAQALGALLGEEGMLTVLASSWPVLGDTPMEFVSAILS